MKEQFHFKQFTIRHDRCAMKVGTDGVLLGAWGTVAPPHILDIGTGTGLIALMAAQRCPEAQVLGIDIDGDAVEQARENVAASPFADRVGIRQQSLQELAKEADNTRFSAILCNPPFFEESLLPPDVRRSQARHTPTLPFPVLIHAVGQLLQTNGTFSVILPTNAFDDFRRSCFTARLLCTRLCHVQTTPTKTPKRILATFRLTPADSTVYTSETSALPSKCDGPTTLILNHGTARTPEYAALTHDFYLW